MVLEDFKSFSWASSASGVGSIPTRSRHLMLLASCVIALVAGAGADAAHAQSPPADTTRTELPLVRSIGRGEALAVHCIALVVSVAGAPDPGQSRPATPP